MIKIPPYLVAGDTIGIVCPAGYMPYEKAATCIDTLKQWGFRVETGKTLGSQHFYFSGTDEERLQDIQQMMDNPNIKAILCGRGGYGVSRIIDRLNFNHFLANPKWIIGFSDITVFHSHIYNNYGIATIHAPMAAAFNDGEATNEYIQSLHHCITGVSANYRCPTHEYNRHGITEAPLVGGNLSLLAHSIGTPTDIDTNGKLLFIEDIGEYIYNIDRMMVQLKRSGKLNNLAGLILGRFTDMKDTTTPFGTDVLTAIREHIAPFSYPVCFEFPVSHERENLALKVGCTYQLKVTAEEVHLSEAAIA